MFAAFAFHQEKPRGGSRRDPCHCGSAVTKSQINKAGSWQSPDSAEVRAQVQHSPLLKMIWNNRVDLMAAQESDRESRTLTVGHQCFKSKGRGCAKVRNFLTTEEWSRVGGGLRLECAMDGSLGATGRGSRQPSAAANTSSVPPSCLSDLHLPNDVVRIKLSCFNAVTATFARHISS